MSIWDIVLEWVIPAIVSGLVMAVFLSALNAERQSRRRDALHRYQDRLRSMGV